MTSASPQSKPSPTQSHHHHHHSHPSISRHHDPPPPPTQSHQKPAIAVAPGAAAAPAHSAANNPSPNSNGKLHPSITRLPLRSNFDLEPNPFEQSFSSTPAVSKASATTTNALGSDSQRPDSEPSIHSRDADDPSQGDPHSPHNPDRQTAAAAASGDDTKPILPPLASIVSPAEPFSGWAMSNSLRAGPLSPAMLAGPANQTSLGLGAFDSSFVRTGLTPDVSRTGFTPLIAGGGSFPPPTPNTAALFAIVNGTSTGQAPSNTATITPNTLNALNGVLNGTLGVGSTAPPLDSQSNGQHIGSQNYDIRHDANGRPNDTYGYQPDSYADNAAASALYLLSLQNSMRPQQQQIAPSALSNQSDQQHQHQYQHQHQHQHQHEANENAELDETTRRANKRKSMDTPAAPTTRGGKKAKAAPAASPTVPVRSSSRRRSTRAGLSDLDDDDDDEDGDETYGGILSTAAATMNGRQTASTAGGKAAQRKPETEEEKRRNFLERNRQGMWRRQFVLVKNQKHKNWFTDAILAYLLSSCPQVPPAQEEVVARLAGKGRVPYDGERAADQCAHRIKRGDCTPEPTRRRPRWCAI